MSQVKFHKVASLPGTLDPNAIYFVSNSTFAEIYVTDNGGTAKSGGNSAMITALANAAITAALADFNAIEIVATIAARDAFAVGKQRNLIVLVSNAIGDATVASGAALYSWSEVGATWAKLTEFESLDVTLQWANIVGKPTSSPATIDDAVTKRHTHANQTTLDKFGEDANGATFNGSPVSASWNTQNW